MSGEWQTVREMHVFFERDDFKADCCRFEFRLLASIRCLPVYERRGTASRNPPFCWQLGEVAFVEFFNFDLAFE